MTKKAKQHFNQLKQEVSDLRYLLHKSEPTLINFRIIRSKDNSKIIPEYTYTLIGYKDACRIFELPLNTFGTSGVMPFNFNVYYCETEENIILRIETLNRITDPILTSYYIYHKDTKTINPSVLETLKQLDYTYYYEHEIF